MPARAGAEPCAHSASAPVGGRDTAIGSLLWLPLGGISGQLGLGATPGVGGRPGAGMWDVSFFSKETLLEQIYICVLIF